MSPTYHLREVTSGSWQIDECWTRPRIDIPAGWISAEGKWTPGETAPAGRALGFVPSLKRSMLAGLTVREARAAMLSDPSA